MEDTSVEIQMYSCPTAEVPWMPKHNATQLFQEQSDTEKDML